MANPFSQTYDENYNPFAAASPASDSYSAAKPTPPAPSPQPAPVAAPAPAPQPVAAPQVVVQTVPQGAPPTQGTGIMSALNGVVNQIPGMQLTDAELAARENALAQREMEITNKEQQVSDAKANGTMSNLVHHPKNFPPFIKIWAYYPDEDLPKETIPMMNWLKWIFYAGAIILLYNWIICFCCFSQGARDAFSSPATLIVMSTIYLFLLTPLSFEMCFFVLYKALQTKKGIRYLEFLFTYACFFAFHVTFALGIDGTGAVGWINTITLFQKSAWVGSLALIYSILETLLSVGIGFTWYKSFKFYRTQGLDKATLGEASTIAAGYAADNKEAIVKTAVEHPEIVRNLN